MHPFTFYSIKRTPNICWIPYTMYNVLKKKNNCEMSCVNEPFHDIRGKMPFIHGSYTLFKGYPKIAFSKSCNS